MTAAVRDPFLDPRAGALLARWGAPRRALFLDRDGVVNIDHGYVHTPERTEFLPGIFARVRAAIADGAMAIVVTNQAGIGRGYYDEAAFLEYTAWLHRRFAEEDAPLLATYWCPHHPQAGLGDYRVACACRKPQPGMLLAARARFRIDMAGSTMIGDKDSDMEAARAAGVAHRVQLSEDRAGRSYKVVQ